MLTDFFLKGHVLKKFDWIDHGGKVGPSPVTQGPHNSGTPGPLGPLVLSWKNWSQSWDPGPPWNLLYPRDSRTPETTETLGPPETCKFLVSSRTISHSKFTSTAIPPRRFPCQIHLKWLFWQDMVEKQEPHQVTLEGLELFFKKIWQHQNLRVL